jgi:hypothetical protein
MNTRSKCVARGALIAAAAVASLAAPAHPRAAELLSDAHEIPPFVLQRVDLATVVSATAQVSTPRESR